MDTNNNTHNEKEHPLEESQVVLEHEKDISVKRKWGCISNDGNFHQDMSHGREV